MNRGTTQITTESKMTGTGAEVAFGKDNSVKYYLHGKLHRTDGPAVMRLHIEWYEEYWLDGKKLTKSEFNAVPYTTS
jgi:hypothetical protein